MPRLRNKTAKAYSLDLAQYTVDWVPEHGNKGLAHYLLRHGLSHIIAELGIEPAQERMLSLPYLDQLITNTDSITAYHFCEACQLAERKEEYLQKAEEFLQEEDEDSLAIVLNSLELMREAQWTSIAVEIAMAGIKKAENDYGLQHVHTLNAYMIYVLFAKNFDKAFQDGIPISETAKYIKKAIDGFTELYGANHPSTINCRTYYGVWLVNGASKQPENYFHKLIESALSNQSANQENLVEIYKQFAIFWDKEDNTANSLYYFEKALETSRATFGTEHKETFLLQVNAAALMAKEADELPIYLYRFSFKWRRLVKTARSFFHEGLIGLENMLGDVHPDLAKAYEIYADTLMKYSQYDKAVNYFNRAISAYEQAFGIYDKRTIDTYRTLAEHLVDLDRLDEAKIYFYKEILGVEASLSQNYENAILTGKIQSFTYDIQGMFSGHPSTTETEILNWKLSSLCKKFASFITENLEDANAAEVFYLKEIARNEKKNGLDHPITATTYENYAIFLDGKSKYDQAAKFYKKAINGMEQTFGKDHKITGDFYNNYAQSLYDQARYDQWLEYKLKFLKNFEKWEGKNPYYKERWDRGVDWTINWSTRVILNESMFEQNEFRYLKLAEKFFFAAVDTVQYYKSGEDENIYFGYARLLVLERKDLPEAAEEFYLKAIKTDEAKGNRHSKMGRTYSDYADCLAKHEQAEEFYLKAIESYENSSGKDHETTSYAYKHYANYLTKQAKFEQAEEFYLKAIESYETSEDKGVMAYSDYADCLANQSKYELAEKIYLESINYLESQVSIDPYEKSCQYPDNLGRFYKSYTELLIKQNRKLKALTFLKDKINLVVEDPQFYTKDLEGLKEKLQKETNIWQRLINKISRK